MDNSGIVWTSAGLSLLVGALLVLFLYFLVRDLCDSRRKPALSRKERRLYRKMRIRREEFSYTIPLRDVIGNDEQGVDA